MRKLLAVVWLVVLSAGPAWADSVASGTANFGGRSISYKLTGECSAGVSSRSNNRECNISITLDGKTQELRVTKKELVYQGMTIPLNDFKTMEITGDAEKIRIVVDGTQVFPRVK